MKARIAYHGSECITVICGDGDDAASYEHCCGDHAIYDVAPGATLVGRIVRFDRMRGEVQAVLADVTHDHDDARAFADRARSSANDRHVIVNAAFLR